MPKRKRRPNVVAVATELMTPIAKELGLQLWDVQYTKEGSQWYLRYFIDKEGGLTIDDCEAASRAVEERLDEEDPISVHYILEVSSPGAERRLHEDWQFQQYIGHRVHVRFYQAFEGQKNYYGTLTKKDGDDITVQLDDETELQFKQKEAAIVDVVVDFGFGG